MLFDGALPATWSGERIRGFFEELRARAPAAEVEVAWHLAHMAALCAAGEEGGLSFKHSKSQLLQHQLILLGTVVGRHGLEPDPEKVRALERFPPPASKTQLREFFGAVNWLRPFLGPEFTETSAPLRKLLKKKVPDDCGELGSVAVASFRGLIRLAVDHVKLAVPDYGAAGRWKESGAPFEIFLDASAWGWVRCCVKRM